MRPELQQAVTELQKGTSDAMNRAVALLQQTVFSFSMRVCGHREDAEDTAQETLLRTVPQLPKFESPQALAVWLYKVARSRCLMSRRRSKFAPREPLSLEEVMPDRAELESALESPQRSPEQQLLRAENAAELRRAILKIPPDYRQILVLHDMEELSAGEVARITGLRPGTVRVRLHRARAYLRNQLAVKPTSLRPTSAKPRQMWGTHRTRGRKAGPGAHCKRMFGALSAYLDQEIDAQTCAALESHLNGCPPCKAYLASLEETVRRCKQCPPEELKARVSAEVREMVRQAYAGKSS
ncbi:MAG: sigma-70 family RNA polymerase sigma factor [Terriglobales bacterium]